MIKALRSILSRVRKDERVAGLKIELDQAVRMRVIAGANEIRHVKALGAIVTGLQNEIAREHGQ